MDIIKLEAANVKQQGYKEMDVSIYRVDPHNVYGQREVPNIKLNAINTLTGKEVEIFFDTITKYEETYDSVTGFTTVFITPLFAPRIYETLTSSHFTKFTIETSNYWRCADDGKDHVFVGLTRNYNRMQIEHTVNANGDFLDWTLSFYNDDMKEE